MDEVFGEIGASVEPRIKIHTNKIHISKNECRSVSIGGKPMSRKPKNYN
jgi:hypothetical protein